MHLGYYILLPLVMITYSFFFSVYKLEEHLEPDMEIFSYGVSCFFAHNEALNRSQSHIMFKTAK